MRWRVLSENGVELDEEFGTTDAERRAAEDAADFLTEETGVPHLVRRGKEVVYRTPVRRCA